jgi:hypothetical protein
MQVEGVAEEILVEQVEQVEELQDQIMMQLEQQVQLTQVVEQEVQVLVQEHHLDLEQPAVQESLS